MKKYTTEKEGVTTEYEFFRSGFLPGEFPISTPLTFAFIGQNLVVVKKENGWWDVIGGKLEAGETWMDALKREVQEEAGILIESVDVVGYILAKNSGDEKRLKESLKFPETNILPVTVSFVKEVDKNWKKKETMERDALERSEAKKLFLQRNDNGQLAEIFDHIVAYYDEQKYDYIFEYSHEENLFENYPNTQSVSFVKTKENEFIVVQEEHATSFSLPGGGCRMDEKAIDCAIRETKEEAQIDIKNIEILGAVIVKVVKNGVTLSVSRQSRYLADVENIAEFIPQKDGFETIARRAVPFDFLQKEVKLLKNNTGDEILADLKDRLCK